MHTIDIENWITDLKNHGHPFVEEYRQLCHKHETIVDAGCGECTISPAKKKEIDKHCDLLHRSVDNEIKAYVSLLNESVGRTPPM